MGQKREKIEIIYDILKAIKLNFNKIKVSHLIRKANVSHTKLKELIFELTKQGIVKEITEKNNKYYSLTEKGYEYFEKLNNMKKFMETFKL